MGGLGSVSKMKILTPTVALLAALHAAPFVKSAEYFSLSEAWDSKADLRFRPLKSVYVDESARFVAIGFISDNGVNDLNNVFNAGDDPTRAHFLHVFFVKPDLTKVDEQVFVISDSLLMDSDELIYEKIYTLISQAKDSLSYGSTSSWIDCLFKCRYYSDTPKNIVTNGKLATLSDFVSYYKAFGDAWIKKSLALAPTTVGKFKLQYGVDSNGSGFCVKCVTPLGKDDQYEIKERPLIRLNRPPVAFPSSNTCWQATGVSAQGYKAFTSEYTPEKLGTLVARELKAHVDTSVNELKRLSENAIEEAKVAASNRNVKQSLLLAKMDAEQKARLLAIKEHQDEVAKKAERDEREKYFVQQVLIATSLSDSEIANASRTQARDAILQKFYTDMALTQNKFVFNKLSVKFNEYKEVKAERDMVYKSEYDKFQNWIAIYIQTPAANRLHDRHPDEWLKLLVFKPSDKLKAKDVSVSNKLSEINSIRREFESTTGYKLDSAFSIMSQ